MDNQLKLLGKNNCEQNLENCQLISGSDSFPIQIQHTVAIKLVSP